MNDQTALWAFQKEDGSGLVMTAEEANTFFNGIGTFVEDLAFGQCLHILVEDHPFGNYVILPDGRFSGVRAYAAVEAPDDLGRFEKYVLRRGESRYLAVGTWGFWANDTDYAGYMPDQAHV